MMSAAVQPLVCPTSGGGGGGGGGNGGGGNGGGGVGPCGACKFLRRKCVAGCIFAPYFDSEQGAAHFAAVHKVFGASNVSKLLLHIPMHRRMDAVVTICYEAQARLRDPVYGCVAHILSLQQQVVNLQGELAYLQAHLASLEIPTPPPPPPPAQSMMVPPPLSIADLPPASSIPPSFDLSSLFDPMGPPGSWPTQAQAQYHRPGLHDPRHFIGQRPGGPPASTSGGGSGGGGDLQALARDLLHRQQGLGAVSHVPSSDPSRSSSLAK